VVIKLTKWDARLRGHDTGFMNKNFLQNIVTTAKADVPFVFDVRNYP
jgi:hypothetical protein